MGYLTNGLSFATLRDANRMRLPQFRNKHGQLAHSQPDCSDWSPAQWLQAVVGDMIERKWGRIIFTSSSTAQNGSIGQINYSAAKSAVLGMTRTAARELGKHNILVNAVAPASATEMTKTVMEDPKFADIRAVQAKMHPLRRTAEPEEVAKSYVFLASELSSYVTGQVLSVDGGSMLVR